ncbi:MAG TPA: isoprenylcysteine carboxylmethyltransferase family protein [Ginsengibacter sp.]|nr:isoprenylcysteine carboxylmethyltransferase family protein [Chitinophagaceae bacterium]HRN71690.1 isoprenylcysteine carboxylmethyltransferase family protein [Ginsengibacter sp.]HRP44854.1 isoprenylcysteine carboxylmethyltransferase family protein [Ginsengibacter sp.]
MAKYTDHPHIYIPPPTFFVLFFVIGIVLSRLHPLHCQMLPDAAHKILGGIFFLGGGIVGLLGLLRFLKAKTTFATFQPANSLQTEGIYACSRNPMYLGLFLVYLGLSLWIISPWNIAMIPLLYLTVRIYIIHREEKYLGNRFGQSYSDYRNKVRRWLGRK